jgi:hypothetical protein
LFGVGCVLVLVLSNIARGWRAAQAAELGVADAIPYTGADGRPHLESLSLYDVDRKQPRGDEREPETAAF